MSGCEQLHLRALAAAAFDTPHFLLIKDCMNYRFSRVGLTSQMYGGERCLSKFDFNGM
jgi:hypothetical protein